MINGMLVAGQNLVGSHYEFHRIYPKPHLCLLGALGSLLDVVLWIHYFPPFLGTSFHTMMLQPQFSIVWIILMK